MSLGGSNLVSSGLEDIFLAKYDPAGNCLWVRQAGGTGYDEGWGVATDTAGNVYLIGLYQNTAAFGTASVTSAGLSDIYIAKYDPNGTLLWVSSAGGRDYDEAHAVAVDAAGNAYITGFFDANATFGAYSLLNHSGSDDIFVAKCSSSGAFLWAVQAGGALDDQGNSISLDAGTNVYVTGSFADSALFDTNTLTAAGTNSLPDVFLARYDSAGNLLWVRQAGGGGDDEGYSVAADAEGNISLVGKFFTSATFGPANLSGNGIDAFLARYDSAGNCLWVRNSGGNNAIYGDSGLGVAVDHFGNSFVTGYFSGNADFSGTSVSSTGFDDVFCSKYDAAGNLLWVAGAGGLDLDISYGVAADASGNAVLTGFFASSTVTFGGTTVTNRGGRDVFVAKLGVSIVTPTLTAVVSNGLLVLSWPMAATGFTLESSPSLEPSSWAPFATDPQAAGTNYEVTLPTSDPQRFFRLHQQ